jgi:YfiH family protein
MRKLFEVSVGDIRVSLELDNEGSGVFIPLQRHTDRLILIRDKRELHKVEIADAVITNVRGIKIGVRTADCAGIALWGEEWIGVIHAGWRGLKKGIIPKCVEEMLRHEKNLWAFVSPSAKACCYQVGREFSDMFSRNLHTRGEKLFMDIQEEALQQLKDAGVRIFRSLRECTVCNPRYPSFRRNRTPDRMLTSVIRLQASRTAPLEAD